MQVYTFVEQFTAAEAAHLIALATPSLGLSSLTGGAVTAGRGASSLLLLLFLLLFLLLLLLLLLLLPLLLLPPPSAPSSYCSSCSSCCSSCVVSLSWLPCPACLYTWLLGLLLACRKAAAAWRDYVTYRQASRTCSTATRLRPCSALVWKRKSRCVSASFRPNSPRIAMRCIHRLGCRSNLPCYGSGRSHQHRRVATAAVLRIVCAAAPG